jgi:hypothetical protein
MWPTRVDAVRVLTLNTLPVPDDLFAIAAYNSLDCNAFGNRKTLSFSYAAE